MEGFSETTNFIELHSMIRPL